MPALVLRCTARSDVGGRENNEDALFGSSRLVAVADGVGGAAGGEVASGLAIQALVALDKRRLEAPLEDELRQAVQAGNDTVGFVTAVRPELAGMATTLTAIALSDDGHYLIANIGDSRAYLLRAGRLQRLTRDGSLVQALVDRGALTEAQARLHPHRSVVLSALDGAADKEVALQQVQARVGDRLLLCSDGLSDVIEDAAIAIQLAEPDRERCAAALVEAALLAGGRDNISVLIADVSSGEDADPAWPPAL